MRFRIINLLLAFTLFAFNTAYSQEFRVRNYGLSEGMSNLFVYTINQDVHGFIWAGTGEGVFRFDGFDFESGLVTDSLALGVASVSYRDDKGTLWFGYQGGNILMYDGRNFRMFSGENIRSAVTGLMTLKDGVLIFSTLNDGVFTLDISSGEIAPFGGINEGFFTSLLLDGKILLLGMQESLAVYNITAEGNSAEFIRVLNEIEYSKVNDIKGSGSTGTYWIATEDQGLYRLQVLEDGYLLESAAEGLIPANENVQSVFDDNNGNIWISTQRNGIYRLHQSSEPGTFDGVTIYDENNFLTTNSVKETFQDKQGNIWISTYGKGLSIMVPQAFSMNDLKNAVFNNNVLSLVSFNNNIYAGGDEGLYMTDSDMKSSAVKIKGLPNDAVTSLFLNGQELWIGTSLNGLYIMNLSNSAVRKVSYNSNSLGRTINSITGDNENTYVATRDGIYIFDRSNAEKEHLTTQDGLPYNSVQFVYIDRQGRLLFATQTNGIYSLTSDFQVEPAYRAGDMEIEFVSMTEDQDGNLWAGTRGDGVFYFHNDTAIVFTEESGLISRFCYSIVYTRNGNIWIGHSTGISRINTSTFRISTYDVNTGIFGANNQNAMFIDESGRALLGTNEGIFSYDPSREKADQLPPFTNITRLLISDKPYDITGDINLPYDRYKLRIDFIGLNYGDPQTVTYQYRLDGYETEWSDVTSLNYANYPRIEDGNYTFYVRSYNNEGLTGETPVSISIQIRKPFWKTAWFFILSAVFLIGSVYTYIKIRERKQKQLQEYLEKELDARTKEVVEQKEEIEIKNRDITDSINYAKRIQTSMLPPVKKLQQYFSGSFIFYNPRDIVSGDFYWFDRVNENKFVIVCADSTGHGVPGAFMSMIGSTLIKDICTRVTDNSPCQVLQALDTELSSTLNHDLEDGSRPTDGMDIIVCEIDLRTYYVRFASAMRPMIIYRNGEEIFIQGSRSSIGGHYDREDNVFIDEGLQLTKGDIIYMFSDGYSDQFGGPMGKKFKMVRLKNLLHDIHSRPMEEQYNHVCSTFNLWKENYSQVDDVLFMGIKI